MLWVHKVLPLDAGFPNYCFGLKTWLLLLNRCTLKSGIFQSIVFVYHKLARSYFVESTEAANSANRFGSKINYGIANSHTSGPK